MALRAPRRNRGGGIALGCAAPHPDRVSDRTGRPAAGPFPPLVRRPRLVAARASARAAGKGPRRPLGAVDRAHRRRQDARGISADTGGVERDPADALAPPLRSVRSSPLPPRSGGEGSGVGGGSANSARSCWHRICRSTPHPRPLPTTRFARGGRGEEALQRRRDARGDPRVPTSSPPGAACSAAAACTRSTSRR